MRLQTAGLIILGLSGGNIQDNASISSTNPYPFVGAIPLPSGYHRLGAAAGSFAGWLRQLPLKSDKTVHLYNGRPKGNQKAQYAVLNISVGDKDLQQCADAVMRLRAEWLYTHGRAASIDFQDNARVHYRPGHDTGRAAFNAWLEKVFSYCGSLSLSRQLRDKPLQQVLPGDVFIYGGSPGHAMIVVDVAEDDAGRRIFLLAQSYMPAQEIHVVVNPGHAGLSPWYAAEDGPVIQTPEWTFSSRQLKTWP
ncbi:MAG: hypothetical protein JST39_08810 [Bacteroidetes bacterium]|nr:hypothetical protein [Bacteroidota bacterium]